MRAKIVMNVEIEVATNENDILLADIERWATMHVKNCITDNPDINVFTTVEDTDVAVKTSAIL